VPSARAIPAISRSSIQTFPEPPLQQWPQRVQENRKGTLPESPGSELMQIGET